MRSAVITWKHVFTQGEDKCLSQEKLVVVGPLKTPTNLKGHTCKPDMNTTSESLATISRVNIDILPAERRDSSNSLVQENQPRHLDASNELEGKCSISQVKESLQHNTKSSAQPGNLISTCVSDSVTGEKNDPVKPLQPLNKDQKPKDQVSDTHEVLVSGRTGKCGYKDVGCIVWLCSSCCFSLGTSLNITETKG